MRITLRRAGLMLMTAIGTLVMGCEGTVSLIPDADPALRKPPTAFSEDSAKRQYEATAPRIPDAESRAQYELIVKQLDLANISNRDWANVEVWINGRYVVYCPTFEKKSDKTLYFTMFYDRDGHHFDTDSGKDPIKSVQVYRDGAMYDVKTRVAD